MDNLLSTLKNFHLDGLDELVEQLNLGSKSDQEYSELCDNYSKLLYLDNFFKRLSPGDRLSLINPLMIFLKIIDHKTVYYIENIDWYNEYSELYTESSKIGYYLNKSLYLVCPFEKIKYIILAYSNLIDILKDMGRINFSEFIDDRDFLNTFKW